MYSEYAALFHPNEKLPLRYGRRPELQNTRPGTLDPGVISLKPFSPTNPVLLPYQMQRNALGRLPIPYDPLGFPEVVYLYYPDLKKACTGTLLSSTWVLTAAHCIEYDFDGTGKKPLEMWVTLHRHEVERHNPGTSAPTLFSKAKNFHPHPMYEGNKGLPQETKFDVALIELETGIKVAHYAVIGKTQKSKILGTVAGFGPNLADKVNPSFELDVGWSRVDIEIDTVLWKPIGIINGTETSSLPCPADSGGPIYQLFKNDGAEFDDRIGQGYKDEPRRIIALVSKSRKYENEKGGLKSGKCSLYSEIEGPILETHRPWICETSKTCTVS